MSKFQIGDPVRVKHDHNKTGCVSAIDVNQVLIGKGSPLEGSWWHVDKLELEPHVSDVDGNPIRVGQLVEDVNDVGCYARVVEIDMEFGNPKAVVPRPALRFEGGDDDEWYKPDGLRVVTDTFRPLGPDTRDVTLRVTLHDQPLKVSGDMAVAIVEGVLSRRLADDTVTVEVVDDE